MSTTEFYWYCIGYNRGRQKRTDYITSNYQSVYHLVGVADGISARINRCLK